MKTVRTFCFAILAAISTVANSQTIDIPAIAARPELSGELLRTARRSAAPGTTIQLAAGTYLIPGDVDPGLPARGITIKGAGHDKTILLQAEFADDGRWCAFELADGVTYQDLTLKVPQAAGLQNLTVGWSRGPGQPASTDGKSTDYPEAVGQLARLVRCDIYGPTCAVYSWAVRRNRLILDGCNVYSARVAVGIWASSGADACWFDLYDCRVTVDWAKYGPGAGHTENHLMCGLLARGGGIRAVRTPIKLINGPPLNGVTVDQIVGAYVTNIDSRPATWGDGKYPWIELEHSPVTIAPGTLPIGKYFQHKVEIGRIEQL